MRFQENFGQFLAFALAIHRRDEVAVNQFSKMTAERVTIEFEESEAATSANRNSEKADERLREKMATHMKQLDPFVDEDGREWLRSQISD